MSNKNEKALEILREQTETYFATKYSKEQLTKIITVVITDYIAASKGIEEAYELLAELDDTLEFFESEGL